MKIRTSAIEMAIQAPEPVDLATIRYCIPHPDQFPLPTPQEVASRFVDYVNSEEYRNTFYYNGQTISDATAQLLTGVKSRGSGIAIASYPRLYPEAIQPLEQLWQRKDSADEIANYLMDRPIYYRKSTDPDNYKQYNQDAYVAACLSNLLEWIYLPSAPAYQHLREALLEKARAIKVAYAEQRKNSSIFTRAQRPRTSRNLGQYETALHSVNAGYRILNVEDPYTGVLTSVIELVTWFFTESRTQVKVFKDYFDIENGDVNAALVKVRRSELYQQWASSLSPARYASLCRPFAVEVDDIDEEIRGLTVLRGGID